MSPGVLLRRMRRPASRAKSCRKVYRIQRMAAMALLLATSCPGVSSPALPSSTSVKNPATATLPAVSKSRPTTPQHITTSPFSCSSCPSGHFCTGDKCSPCKAAAHVDCLPKKIIPCTEEADTHCDCGYGYYYDYGNEMCNLCVDCNLWENKTPCTTNRNTLCNPRSTFGTAKTLSQQSMTSRAINGSITSNPATSYHEALSTLPPTNATPDHIITVPVTMTTTTEVGVSSLPTVSPEFRALTTNVPLASTKDNSTDNGIDDKDSSSRTKVIKIAVPASSGLALAAGSILLLLLYRYYLRRQRAQLENGNGFTLERPHSLRLEEHNLGSPNHVEGLEQAQSKSSSNVPSALSTPTPDGSPALGLKCVDMNKLNKELHEVLPNGGDDPSSSFPALPTSGRENLPKQNIQQLQLYQVETSL